MAKDRADAAHRCPPDDLKAVVQDFFERVSRLELPDGRKFRTARTQRPSHIEALIAMGLQESSYSGWKTGNPARDETFNRRLLDGLNGDLKWVAVDDAKKTAVATWAAAQEDPSAAELIPELLGRLTAHGRGLAGADSAKRRATTRNASRAVPAARRADASAPAPRWSNAWTQRTVAP